MSGSPNDVPDDAPDAVPDAALDAALAAYLERREDEPALTPGAFAATLPAGQRAAFLREIAVLGEIDRLAAAAPPRDLPRRFGDFRCLREIGRGGGGTVYEAEQVSHGRRVALKVLSQDAAGDVRGAARFRREARTAAALQHTHIVPILGFGEQDGLPWLAMGFVSGRSLQRLLIARRDPSDVDHAAALAFLGDARRLALAMADVADALDFAHRQGIVHRDIKPGNLMLDDAGKVVVLDFGLARTRRDTSVEITRTGDFLGTPLYMSPEQAAGERDIGPTSDVYSLGAVLYECAAGEPAVADGPLPQILERIRGADPPPPQRRAGDPKT